MKASKLWKTLTWGQRRGWSEWAKVNKVLLDDGNVRRVSGRKAMTMIVRNRELAGEAANPAVVPVAGTWLDGAFSVRDAGVFTAGEGYIGFRCEEALPAGTKWFVWASALVILADPEPLTTMRFLTVFEPAAMEEDDVIPSIGGYYLAVHGDWHPPVNDPPEIENHWIPTRYVWFRLHHYVNGVLSPGRVMRSVVNSEL